MTSGARLFAAAVLTMVAWSMAGWRWSHRGPRIARGVVDLSFASSADSTFALALAENTRESRDVFRLSSAAPVATSNAQLPSRPGLSTAAAGGPRPALTLKAIVGGPPWQAIIDGLPGQRNGAVAQSGTVFERLLVRAVTRDSVVITGLDTTWVLRFHADKR